MSLMPSAPLLGVVPQSHLAFWVSWSDPPYLLCFLTCVLAYLDLNPNGKRARLTTTCTCFPAAVGNLPLNFPLSSPPDPSPPLKITRAMTISKRKLPDLRSTVKGKKQCTSEYNKLRGNHLSNGIDLTAKILQLPLPSYH